MTEYEWDVVKSHMIKLFPQCALNDAQSVAWLHELKGLPKDAIIDALDAVFAEKPNFKPAARDIRLKAEFSVAPDRKAEGDDPAQWIRDRWSRLRPEHQATYASWSDAEVFHRHSRQVFAEARLAFGKSSCVRGYFEAYCKDAAKAGAIVDLCI